MRCGETRAAVRVPETRVLVAATLGAREPSPVRHAEVHGVRPEWRVGQRGRDRRVVQERLFLHHGELVVAAHAQVRRPQPDHAVVGQVRVLLRDDTHAGHLLGPVLHGGVAPELLVIVVPATMVRTRPT